MVGSQNKGTTDRSPSSEKGSISAPAITLPKGGGAIRGIGEKFAANPVTGTGSMTVPIITSPGRAGFGPQLSLSYDSGSGNGPFGLGWNLSLPAITRKTDKGLPRYQYAVESDVFILSGAEDLVPVLEQDASGDWLPEMPGSRVVGGKTYDVRRYRPRIEGLFARIERWSDRYEPKNTFWRSISKDNITTWYGKSEKSRVTDPLEPARIFSWLICESYDDKGNAILYEYKTEDASGIDLSQVNEKNRTDKCRGANRYLKRVKYGNKTPRLDGEDLSLRTDWLFEVVFDYEEGHYEALPLDAEGRRFVKAYKNGTHDWPARKDPFSSYRAGFEVRTYRLCRRVLMFHHFPVELGTDDCLVRSTEFDYSDFDYSRPSTVEAELAHKGSTRFAAFITGVTQSGYVRRPDGTYLEKSHPPLEFIYSKAEIDEAVRPVDSESMENLPMGLDGSAYQWVDLDGEGLSGILTEQANAWFYKRNIGGKFGPVELVAINPSLSALNSEKQQLLDLAGDGQIDLVQFEGPMSGFYERTHDNRWERFIPFASIPKIPWSDPDLKFIDLTGDGHADILISEDEVFTWYHSLAEQGFEASEAIRKVLDEEKGARLAFADGTQSIYLADISGDGLTDIVRIRNGEVCYWPNLGYGNFGAKITMDNAPWFDHPDQFDQKRLRLADIDGSGVTDIIYLGSDGVRLYFNQSGNRWSGPRLLSQFPGVDSLSSVTAVDLLGNGTACLVWSSPLPGSTRQPMRYVQLMKEKPHLLTRTANNLGAETHIHYAPSTKFYLADRGAGKPWITRLPFPVHVVERVETYDHISRSRFVTRYAYHHGYFDGIEREFRGFGMVEQWDTEVLAALTTTGELPVGDNIEAASHVPPVLTRTWFHTGIYQNRDYVSNFFAGLIDVRDRGEYYREPAWRDDDVEAGKRLLDDTVLPAGLMAGEEREACRALRGSMLRQEIYALDGTQKQDHPYIVIEQDFTIECLQGRGHNRYAVFFTHAREVINYHYERNPDDPRISHGLTLEVDAYGNICKSLSIGYGRRVGQSPLQGDDRKKQEQTLVTYMENELTDPIDDRALYPDAYRAPLPCETRTYEVTGFNLTGGAVRFSFKDFADNNFQALTGLPEIEYEQPTDHVKKQKRLIECVRILYRKDNLSGLLDKGALERMALPGETYKLAFTPGLLDRVYIRGGQKLLPANPADVLDGGGVDRGGYAELDGDGRWWIHTGRVFYSPDKAHTPEQELDFARKHFFLPHRFQDPFGNSTVLKYDSDEADPLKNHNLLPIETRDAVDNLVRAVNDYRMLQPRLITDPNGNRSEAAFDALGMVVGTAVMGKPFDNLGDKLDGFEPDLTEAVTLDHLANPLADPHAILKRATTRLVYDLFAYYRTKDQSHPEPALVYTLARETHDSDLTHGQLTRFQHRFSYSDGLGREIQKKIQAEPGPVVEGGPVVNRRWVGSGWHIFNNKGKPVRQYEPFFSQLPPEKGHRFEFGIKVGVSPVLFYDPVERVVATLHPNHTYEKMVFDPWRQETWDVNDTVTLEPQDDGDVKGFFVHPDGTPRLPAAEYLPTWHGLRTDTAHVSSFAARYPDPLDRVKETRAAEKTAVHGGTPTLAYFDTLGRTFLTLAHNRFERNGAIVDEKYPIRVEMDIEGNQRVVIDASDRVVMRYDYDMLGSSIHHASMEAGEHWTLNDVAGKPIRAWDSRSFARRFTYDRSRRPEGLYLSDNGAAEAMVEKTVYGETQPNPEAGNLRGKMFKVYDSAGIVTNPFYDFKGNLVRSKRQLVQDYKVLPDWLAAHQPQTQQETFVSVTSYDALNRPIQVVPPYSDRAGSAIPIGLNVIRNNYNEANLLESVHVWLEEGAEPASLIDPGLKPPSGHGVKNIDYNARGQRIRIEYKNDVVIDYRYDRETFRLAGIKTSRPQSLNGLATQLFTDPAKVQDLSYFYDPCGNITCIIDGALPEITYNGELVKPAADYEYDSMYRLVTAKGREHISQTAFDVNPPGGNRRDYPFLGLRANPNDLKAVRNYAEAYEYDAVGNIRKVTHAASGGSWTLDYLYKEQSLLEAARFSNRLTQTGPANFSETYGYKDSNGRDVHGCMTKAGSLGMSWDFKDQLQIADLGGGGRAYYVYNAAGQRVRKAWEKSPGLAEERIYMGIFEVYRKRSGTDLLERETLQIMDDKQCIALVETRTADTAGTDQARRQLVRYQAGNHLGSATLELDQLAKVISYEEYHPYGGTAFQAVHSQTETPKRYRYTGKERDEESGLYYYGARYYAPWLRKWVSCDPAGMVDGPNLFEYVHGNPVRLIDPRGQSGEETKLTKPAVLSALEQKGLPYATEVSFDLVDSAGKTITSGRFDVMTVDPRTGNLIIPELKGKDLGSLTDNQKIYVPVLESSKGGTIKITGSKGGSLGFQSGVTVKVNQENYVRVGVKNLGDFSDALQTVAGGAPVKHSFLDKSGKMHLFSSTEAFKGFLESSGRGSMSSRVVSKLRKAGPVLSIAGVLLWAGSAQAAEVRSEPVTEDELQSLKSNLQLRLSVGNTLNESVNSAPFADLATYMTLGVQIDAIMKLKALDFAMMNNLQQFKGGLEQIENAPYMLDPRSGDIYEINMNGLADEPLGNLTKISTLEKSMWGWYSDSKNVVYREENGKLYLRQW